MSESAIDFYNLGYCYYSGTEGYPLNYGKALEYFQKAAELGQSDAMNYLGLFYKDGEIIAKNERVAAEWFYKALRADSKNAYAAYNLACMYENGTGVPKNITKAYELFKYVTELGNENGVYSDSCFSVGCILMENFKKKTEAFGYFVKSATHDNKPEAWYNMGYLAEQGIIPDSRVGSDRKASCAVFAVECYEKAANQGMMEAFDSIGRIYIVYNQIDKAIPYLEKAASMGCDVSKERLRKLRIANRLNTIHKFMN